MSLEHILLGLLHEPASGYDLGREFEASARMYWFAELSQIYPTLKRLESKGLLTSEEAPSARGPKRKVYRRTADGDAALYGWLRREPQLKTRKLEYIAQLCFLGELEDTDASIRFVQSLQRELEAQMAQYRTFEDLMRRNQPDPADMAAREFHEWAAVVAGIRVAEARLEWCGEMLEALGQRRDRAPTGREAVVAASGGGSS